MTDYEHMIVSNYVLEEIEEDKLSDKCLSVILQDLKDCTYFGNYCDEREWKRLKERIEEVI